MHISEGFLTPQVLAAGWAAASLGVAVGLKKMEPERTVRVAVMSSAFFLASLVNVRIGPVSTHLALIAPTGLILGWASFPAVMIALLLQALFFQFGGLTVLGVNTLDMALPALAAYLCFARMVRTGSPVVSGLAAFVAGAAAVLLGAALLSLFLVASDPGMMGAARVAFATHLPLALIEGVVTLFFAAFLRRVAPDLLSGAGRA